MITHEFEWGEDEFADDPICIRCEKPFTLHTDRVGITDEDETFGDDNSLGYRIDGMIVVAITDW